MQQKALNSISFLALRWRDFWKRLLTSNCNYFAPLLEFMERLYCVTIAALRHRNIIGLVDFAALISNKEELKFTDMMLF